MLPTLILGKRHGPRIPLGDFENRCVQIVLVFGERFVSTAAADHRGVDDVESIIDDKGAMLARCERLFQIQTHHRSVDQMRNVRRLVTDDLFDGLNFETAIKRFLRQQTFHLPERDFRVQTRCPRRDHTVAVGVVPVLVQLHPHVRQFVRRTVVVIHRHDAPNLAGGFVQRHVDLVIDALLPVQRARRTGRRAIPVGRR